MSTCRHLLHGGGSRMAASAKIRRLAFGVTLDRNCAEHSRMCYWRRIRAENAVSHFICSERQVYVIEESVSLINFSSPRKTHGKNLNRFRVSFIERPNAQNKAPQLSKTA